MTDEKRTGDGATLLYELLEVGRLDTEHATTAGFSQLLTSLLSEPDATQRVAKEKVDLLIADIDRRLTAQVNEIMAEPSVKSLETSWRSIKYLVDSIDFREKIRLELLNASKEDLLDDFRNATETVETGLYSTVYKNAIGVYGGKPYGVICSTYDFGPGAEDIELLRSCSAVAAMSHAPFLTNTTPGMFGKNSFQEIPQLRDMESIFEHPRYAQWHSFRESEDARYVGVCLPRFLLRAPYGARESELSVKDFDFSEDVIDQHERYLWGPASVALTSRIADAFARYRWCPNIIGPQAGGAIENLPLHQYRQDGEFKTKDPCEAPIEYRKEYEFAEQGFIPLVPKQGTNAAVFFSANSAQKPKVFPATPEGLEAQRNFMLGTRLPYMFVITRLSHYLKAIVAEKIGKNIERKDLQKELNDWIRQYISAMEDPHPDIRAKRPLKGAEIEVEDVPGQVGWYRCNIKVRPHMKFEGASFELSLVGRLDNE